MRLSRWFHTNFEEGHRQRTTLGRMLMGAIWLTWLLIAFPSYKLVYAQTPVPPGLKVTIGQFDVSKYPEITVYVNVTDSAGKYVVGLTKENFAITEDGQPVQIVDFAGLGQARPVDIVYVFDTTGSMSEEIKGAINTSIAFADRLVSQKRDYRLGLVTFADIVLQVHREDNSLTSDAEEFKRWVSGLEAQGGDDDPENDYAAIKRAMQMQFRTEAQKVFILITDAPIHHYNDPADGGHVFTDPDLDKQRILSLLKEKNISVYAIAPNLDEFISLATESGGKFYDIQKNPDFTSLIGEIGETIANQYRITYRSPRPSYDGTRRNVVVKIGEAGATVKYHEQHLLNVQSNILVGILCLFPLMVALIIPMAIQFVVSHLHGQPVRVEVRDVQVEPLASGEGMDVAKAPVEVPSPAVGAPPLHPPAVVPSESAGGINCRRCGRPVYQGARFCTACGEPVPQVIPPASVEGAALSPAPNLCPRCGNAVRAGAKFCNACGFKL